MRPITSYRITVHGPREGLHDTADWLKAQAVEVVGSVDQSGVTMDEGTAFVRVRLPSNDATARNTAMQIVGNVDFVLTTGYGVHNREIKS